MGRGMEKTSEVHVLRMASEVLRMSALSLTALVSEIDAFIAEEAGKIDAVEHAYVHGAHGITAGNPTVLRCLSERRLLLETARDLRARMAEAAADLERGGGAS